METVLNMISNLSVPAPAALPLTDDIPSNSQQLSGTSTSHSSVITETTNDTLSTQNLTSSTNNEAKSSVVLPPNGCFNTIGCTATPSNNSSIQQQNTIENNSSYETTSNNGRVEQSLPQLQQFHQRNTGRTFFRAPGLEAPDENSGDFPTNALVCPDCGFSCSSKFHYNSHRNTHSTHQCPICKFETRTEGRLKKHMLQSHKREQRQAAGINIQSPPPTPTTIKHNSPSSISDLSGDKFLTQKILANQGIPTDGISLLNSMLSAGDNPNGTLALESLQSMLNNTNSIALNSTDALLKICSDAITSNGPNNKTLNLSPQLGDFGHIPLEQLRALTERQAAFITTSTANSLNMGDLQIGPEASLLANDTNQQQNGQQNGADDKQDTPRRSGKPKQYKCKTCQHISRSKKEQWAHNRLHIPKQKQLTCALCDFVTEYKHHLEYHYRNHNGQKPFKCSICDYTCVNKSMLNSHMKSHTPVYQFRCQDCTYQTKYCHSLKMHLKKYNHKRAPGPSGFVDSSDSHGEDRPENASSSSIGREDTASFENGAPSGTLQAEGHTEGTTELIGALSTTVHHHHHPLLNDPSPGDTAELELTSHRLMLQQQLEQMSGFIRNAVVSCPHCSFSTGNIDEMNKHLLFHLIVTQQPLPTALSNEQHALTSIYQRLTAQLHQGLIPGSEGAAQPHQMISASQPHHQNAAHSLLSHALAVVSTGSHNQQQTGDDVPMELSVSASLPPTITSDKEGEGCEAMDNSIRQQLSHEQHIHFTPTTMAEMLATVAQPPRNDITAPTSICTEMESARGGGCTTDGTSTTTPASNNNEPSTHSQQLSYSPISKSLKREFAFGNNTFHSSVEGGTAVITQEKSEHVQSTIDGATGTCVITNVMPRLVGSIPGMNNGFELRNNSAEEEFSAGTISRYGGTVPGNVQVPSGVFLPYFCQQCEIAFKDAALYQVHRGFHARENVFKCNICGHLSASSLDFNLHLYQAKHE